MVWMESMTVQSGFISFRVAMMAVRSVSAKTISSFDSQPSLLDRNLICLRDSSAET